MRYFEIEHPVSTLGHKHVLHREVAVNEAATLPQFLDPRRHVAGRLWQPLDDAFMEWAQAQLLERLVVIERRGDLRVAFRPSVPKPERLTGPGPHVDVRAPGFDFALPVGRVSRKKLHNDHMRQRVVVEHLRHTSGREPTAQAHGSCLDVCPFLLCRPVVFHLEPRQSLLRHEPPARSAHCQNCGGNTTCELVDAGVDAARYHLAADEIGNHVVRGELKRRRVSGRLRLRIGIARHRPAR